MLWSVCQNPQGGFLHSGATGQTFDGTPSEFLVEENTCSVDAKSDPQVEHPSGKSTVGIGTHTHTHFADATVVQHFVTHQVARTAELEAESDENVEYVVMVDREANEPMAHESGSFGGDLWNARQD